jgi:hypothetical protein
MHLELRHHLELLRVGERATLQQLRAGLGAAIDPPIPDALERRLDGRVVGATSEQGAQVGN